MRKSVAMKKRNAKQNNKEIKIKVIKRWEDYFKLSDKAKCLSRIAHDDMIRFFMESTLEQRNEYSQILEDRIAKQLGKTKAKEVIDDTYNELIKEINNKILD